MTVNVRVLPVDTPGVPPSVPYVWPQGYGFAQMCLTLLRRDEVDPHTWAATLAPPQTVGYRCTRPKHDDSKPHVCHQRRNGQPLNLVVWDTE